MNCPAGAREAGLGHDLGAPQVVLQGFALRGEVLSQMGKYPKDRRGTPQRRTSFANDGLPPVPHYGGTRTCQVLQNFRRAKSEWPVPITAGPLGPGIPKIVVGAVPLLRLALPSR